MLGIENPEQLRTHALLGGAQPHAWTLRTIKPRHHPEPMTYCITRPITE